MHKNFSISASVCSNLPNNYTVISSNLNVTLALPLTTLALTHNIYQPNLYL